jgi:glycosyltransferase involved in cell wall biosynthesis
VRITFLVERPTQFEAPFYRFAAADPSNQLRVVFTAPDAARAAFDPELGRQLAWGIDLLGGYPHETWSSAMAARLRPDDCDLLIVNGYAQPEYRQAVRHARRSGVRTALRLDSVPWQDKGWRRAAKRALFAAYLDRAFDLFLGVGSLTLDYLRRNGVPEHRRGLFPYAVDIDWFRSRADGSGVRERLGVPPAAKLLLSLAKLHPREAPRDLLRAFAMLERKDLWLVVAGDGPLRGELERAAPERVVFPGYVPYPDLPSLYAAADLFVHPAPEERWGVSVEEALACGLPVVASSRVGAAYDLLVGGENGFTYPAGDSAALASKLVEALAISTATVRAKNREILARWDYAASWRALLEAASRR